jgi:phosphatidylethanolamine/phosphatidyl-N-methylethanolamine N-methyltransferase
MRLHTAQLFFRQWLQEPLSTGSVLPSGTQLSRALAREMAKPADGPVVELGPGTGAVTRALLDHGIAPHRLVLVERNREFVVLLRRQFPQLRVLEGDATCLDQLLAQAGIGPVGGVVSSLPLRSLSFDVQRRALRAAVKVLVPGRRLVQYTYGFAPPIHPVLTARLQLAGHPVARVLLNVPPAVVWSYGVVAHAPLSRAA